MINKEILKKILKEKTGKITDKVGSGIGSMMSIPSNFKRKVYTEPDLKLLKEKKKYGNAPDRNADGSVTDAYKTRFMADEMVNKRKKDIAKKSIKKNNQ